MVEMKYTKFVISEIKRKVSRDPKPTAVKIPVYVDKQIKTENKVEKYIDYSDTSVGPMASIMGIVTALIAFIVVFTIYGSVASTINMGVIEPTTSSLINLIPLVLVGAAMIGVIITALRLSV